MNSYTIGMKGFVWVVNINIKFYLIIFKCGKLVTLHEEIFMNQSIDIVFQFANSNVTQQKKCTFKCESNLRLTTSS